MTKNPAPRRKKAALILMFLAPIFALSPLLAAAIAVRITPECAVVPNCAGGALAYFILLTVPIGIVLFGVGLIMLLAAKRPNTS
jgi:hypothetical protein